MTAAQELEDAAACDGAPGREGQPSCPIFRAVPKSTIVPAAGRLIRSPTSAILNGPTLTTIDTGADVVGLGQIALDTAPIFGGAMLAIAAGQFRGPDYREQIKRDMDLLDRLPPQDAKRRAQLQRSIDARIDDLLDVADRSRALRRAAASYQGNWRDVVLLLCVLLFTVVWWDVSHSRSNWLVMFVLLILLSVVTAVYAFRGMLRAASSFVRSQHGAGRQGGLAGAGVGK
jgi:hypothetical protein